MKKRLDEFSADQVKEAESALDKCDRLMPDLMRDLISHMATHDLSPDYALLVVSRLAVPVLAVEMRATGEHAVPLYHALCKQVVVHAASDALLETEH
jgi:hypothetical protein